MSGRYELAEAAWKQVEREGVRAVEETTSSSHWRRAGARRLR